MFIIVGWTYGTFFPKSELVAKVNDKHSADSIVKNLKKEHEFDLIEILHKGKVVSAWRKT